jgi:hypothetical protein
MELTDIVTAGLGGAARIHYLCRVCEKTTTVHTFIAKNGSDWGAAKKNAVEPSAAILKARKKAMEHARVDHGPAAIAGLVAHIPVEATAQGNNVARQHLVSRLLTTNVWSYAQYRTQCSMDALEHPMGEETYKAIVHELGGHLASELQLQLQDAHSLLREEFVNTCMAGDGCYVIRGHFSTNMTAILLNVDTGLTVGVLHLCQDAKTAFRHVSPNVGSSKSAEKHGVDALCWWLKGCGVTVSHFVLDGDASTSNVITAAFPDARHVPCFNHVVRALVNRLQEVVKVKDCKTPSKGVATQLTTTDRLQREALLAIGVLESVDTPVPDDWLQCQCKARNHRRKATASGPACGCPDDAFAANMRLYMHAVATAAGDSPARYRELMTQLQRHVAGDHSTCTTHPRMRCDGSCPTKCPTRRCSCETERCRIPGSDVAACWGQPVEPTCAGVPWESRGLPAITCRMHLLLVITELQREKNKAEILIIPELGGVKVCVA